MRLKDPSEAKHRSRVLAILTDAYGSHGGISQVSRDILEALVEDPRIEEVVALPRIIPQVSGPLPDKLTFDAKAAAGLPAYVRALARAIRTGPFDLVYCAHINLLPFAWVAARMSRASLVLTLHGVEAWKPTSRIVTNQLAGRADLYLPVSQLTLDRFRRWCPAPIERFEVMPNAVRLEQFGPGPINSGMVDQLGLAGRKVILTLGRLTPRERYKGFDEVIDILPRLIEHLPDLVYVIAGTGEHRDRLETRVADLGLQEHVRFTGFVAEEDKPDLYRLADLFVLASRGEGFGIVLLEAMACGTPVIASALDGGREAVRDGRLGRLVDPTDPDALVDAIIAGLKSPRHIPDGLDYFGKPAFAERFRNAVLPASRGPNRDRESARTMR